MSHSTWVLTSYTDSSWQWQLWNIYNISSKTPNTHIIWTNAQPVCALFMAILVFVPESIQMTGIHWPKIDRCRPKHKSPHAYLYWSLQIASSTGPIQASVLCNTFGFFLVMFFILRHFRGTEDIVLPSVCMCICPCMCVCPRMCVCPLHNFANI